MKKKKYLSQHISVSERASSGEVAASVSIAILEIELKKMRWKNRESSSRMAAEQCVSYVLG